MDSLKTVLIVGMLAAIAYGVYVSINNDRQAAMSPEAAEGWPSGPPSIQLGPPVGSPALFGRIARRWNDARSAADHEHLLGCDAGPHGRTVRQSAGYPRPVRSPAVLRSRYPHQVSDAGLALGRHGPAVQSGYRCRSNSRRTAADRSRWIDTGTPAVARWHRANPKPNN